MFAFDSVALEPAAVDPRKAVKNYLPSITSWAPDGVGTPLRHLAWIGNKAPIELIKISGTRPALIEAGWKKPSRVVQGLGAVQTDNRLNL